jgi:hypothetical protein
METAELREVDRELFARAVSRAVRFLTLATRHLAAGGEPLDADSLSAESLNRLSDCDNCFDRK